MDLVPPLKIWLRYAPGSVVSVVTAAVTSGSLKGCYPFAPKKNDLVLGAAHLRQNKKGMFL